MRTRHKLAFLYTVITGIILIIFAVTIYIRAENSREKEFYEVLRNEGVTKANLLFEANIDPSVLQQIYKNNRKLINEVEVAIYSPEFELLYHDAVDIDFVQETPEMIQLVMTNNEIRFYQDDWQVLGISIEFANETKIVVAAAFDTTGFKKMQNLRWNILITLVFAILTTYFFGYFYARRALNPISEITERAKTISATNLDLRLASKGTKDELDELARTFNSMLDRLEKSFDSQREFVSNIAHEIRTPLSAIIGELELTLQKDRSVENYKSAIQRALEDSQRLSKIATSLLDLAKANYDIQRIAFSIVRLDEVVMASANEVQHNNKDYRVSIAFSEESVAEDLENELEIKANFYLLQVAFQNIIENGCKYADNNSCYIMISPKSDAVIVEFKDEGIGISADELDKITAPFYRAKQSKSQAGSGIGLALTKRILDLHQYSLSIESSSCGTNVTVRIPTS